jgi:hypothetical protein
MLLLGLTKVAGLTNWRIEFADSSLLANGGKRSESTLMRAALYKPFQFRARKDYNDSKH